MNFSCASFHATNKMFALDHDAKDDDGLLLLPLS